MNPEIVKICKSISHYRNEHLLLITCKNNEIVQSYKHLSIGSRNSLRYEVHDIINKALHDSADQIFLCHNHPNGKIAESEDDKKADKGLTYIFSKFGIEHNLCIVSKFGFKNITKQRGISFHETPTDKLEVVFQVDTIVNKLQDEKMFSITFDQLKRVSSYSVQNSLHEVPSAYYKDIQASSIVFCVNTEKVNIKECNEIHESIRNGFFADYWINEFSYIHANEQGWELKEGSDLIQSEDREDLSLLKKQQTQSDLPKMPDLSKTNGMTM